MKMSAKDFMKTRMDTFCDYIRLNSCVNFYENDYKKLVANEAFTHEYKAISIREFMSFSEIQICKGKMITGVTWHPYLTGVVICSYGGESLNKYTQHKSKLYEGETETSTHNPVLMWSSVDGLKPKLSLEAHREVTSVSFCPYDENIVIGGCRNGQIIIWDIRDKLENVETDEFLLPAQQNYRSLMESKMKWTKKVKDVSKIPVTAVSDLQYSHYSTVTQIEWMPPFQEITKTGITVDVPKDRLVLYSYQFVTSSLDGTLLFWDMKIGSQRQSAHFRTRRRLRRLHERPSGLTVNVSPLRCLHRAIKPIYKLSLINEDSKNIPILCFAMPYYNINYKQVNPNQKKKFHVQQRNLFEPIFEKPKSKYPQKLCIGSSLNDFIFAKWDGYEYSSGDIVVQETAVFSKVSIYHDGPITSLVRWPHNPEIILSIGGSIICLWNENYKDTPILWRKSKVKYTHGTWNPGDISTFTLTKEDGNIEVWSLYLKSYEFIRQQTLSGQLLTGLYASKICPQIIGIADYNGSLRIYHSVDLIPKHHVCDAIFNLLMKQIEITNDFKTWQSSWLKRNASTIITKEKQADQLQEIKKELDTRASTKAQKETEHVLKETAKLAALKTKPQPGEFKKWAEEKWRQQEQERMHRVLLQLKQLRPDQLREQQKPLKRMQKEERHKREKQKKIHANAQKIFNDAVAMYFPHVLKKEAPPERDPYAGGDTVDSKQTVMKYYKDVTCNTQKYIERNPFVFELDWKQTLKSGKERRRSTFDRISTHKERQEERKNQRIAYSSIASGFSVSVQTSASTIETGGGGDN